MANCPLFLGRRHLRTAYLVMLFLASESALAQAPSLEANPNELFFSVQFGTSPSSQTLTVDVPGNGAGLDFTVSASVTTPEGVNWLSVSPSGGTTPETLTVTVDPTGLAPGFDYTGTVTITAAGASNSPLTVAVTFNVFGARQMTVNTNLLDLVVSVNGTALSQQVVVSAIGVHIGELIFSTSVDTDNGVPWLSVSPNDGITPQALTVSVNASGLAAGFYLGSIFITDTANNTVLVRIRLNVSTAPFIHLEPGSLSFLASPGSDPAPQTFQVENEGSGTLGWTATAATESGGNWLSVSPTDGVAPSTLTVTIHSATLARGAYTGSITISALESAGTLNSPQVLTVELAVGIPTIGQNGIVNGASFSTDAVVSPGSIVSLFGVELAREIAFAEALPLPTTLADTQVLVNDSPAPLFFVSANQINFQMPTGLSGSTAQVVVVAEGIRGPEATVELALEVPGIFSTNQQGTGQGAVLNQDFSANSADNPAAVGSVIQIFATGLGKTDPPVAAGEPGAAEAPFNLTTMTPLVTVGDLPAEILFSAMAPGFVGLYQVNARVPEGTPPGNAVPLQIQMGTQTSNTVTIGVQ